MEVQGNGRIEPEGIYDTNEAAALLQVSIYTMRQWRSDNVGPVYYKRRRSKSCFYKGADLIEWDTNDSERIDPRTHKA